MIYQLTPRYKHLFVTLTSNIMTHSILMKKRKNNSFQSMALPLFRSKKRGMNVLEQLGGSIHKGLKVTQLHLENLWNVAAYWKWIESSQKYWQNFVMTEYQDLTITLIFFQAHVFRFLHRLPNDSLIWLWLLLCISQAWPGSSWVCEVSSLEKIKVKSAVSVSRFMFLTRLTQGRTVCVPTPPQNYSFQATKCGSISGSGPATCWHIWMSNCMDLNQNGIRTLKKHWFIWQCI